MSADSRWPGPREPEREHPSKLFDLSRVSDPNLRLLRVVLRAIHTIPALSPNGIRPRWLAPLLAWLLTPPPPAPEPAPAPWQSGTALPRHWAPGDRVPPNARSADVRRMDSRDLDDAFASALSGAPPEIAEALRMLSAALAKQPT